MVAEIERWRFGEACEKRGERGGKETGRGGGREAGVLICACIPLPGEGHERGEGEIERGGGGEGENGVHSLDTCIPRTKTGER